MAGKNLRKTAANGAIDRGDKPGKEFWSKVNVILPARKKHISIRIDTDVLAWFQAQGRGYQGRMNAVLRSYMEATGSAGANEISPAGPD